MKRAIIAVSLILMILLTGCGGGEAARDVTADQLVGVWQQDNYQTLLSNRETAYEVYFTEDELLYILVSFDALDIGYHTEILECSYSVADNALRWAESDKKCYLSGNVTDIQVKSGRVVLTVREGGRKKRVALRKARDAVPDAYTKDGKKQALARKQALREEIIAFSEQLSERTGLPVRVNEEEDFLLDVPESVYFSSGDVNFHITQGKYAEGDERSGYTIAIPSGAMNYYAPCYVVDGYAIVFDVYSGDIPQEWQNALG